MHKHLKKVHFVQTNPSSHVTLEKESISPTFKLKLKQRGFRNYNEYNTRGFWLAQLSSEDFGEEIIIDMKLKDNNYLMKGVGKGIKRYIAVSTNSC